MDLVRSAGQIIDNQRQISQIGEADRVGFIVAYSKSKQNYKLSIIQF